MQYQFPVFAKGSKGPTKFVASCDVGVGDPIGWTNPGTKTAENTWVMIVDHNNVKRQPPKLLQTAIVEAIQDAPDDAEVVVPWSRGRLPHVPGCNDMEMARRVYVAGKGIAPYRVHDERPAVYACRLELMQPVDHKDVGDCVAYRAPRAWAAFDDVGDHPYDSPTTIAHEIARTCKPTQRQAVFVFRELPICGATLAAAHICNELNQHGWNATIACTDIEQSQHKLFPFEFGPMVFRSVEEMVGVLKRRMHPDSVVVAPVHAMVDVAAEVSQATGARMVYYVQDDERRFRTIHGVPYGEAEVYERGWAKAAEQGDLIANSLWVADMLHKRGHPAAMIPIGVDTDVFRQGANRGKPPFKIMAHCRHSTPRRGWAFICAVLNQLAIRGLQFQAVTYDEEPLGLQVPDSKHLGKLSPAQVAEAMASAHVFIEGSDVQGFGMQALEAMACGCALVCTDNRGIHTFGIDGRDCVVVKHGDVAAATAEVMRLATDRQHRARLAVAARYTAVNYDWREVCTAWDRVLSHRGSAADDEENP